MAAAMRAMGIAAALTAALAWPLTAHGGETVRLFNGKDLDGFTTWLKGKGKTDPDGVFSVEDGAIRISGEGYGYLATGRAYRNYRLKLQFRWGDQEGLDRGERAGKALDSGVFLHARGPDGNSHDGEGAYMAAIECNLFQGATGDFLLIRGDDRDGKLIAPRLAAEAASDRDRDGFPFWKAGGERVQLERWGRVNWFGKSRGWKDRRDFRGGRDLEKPSGEWNQLVCTCQGDRIAIAVNGTIVNRISDVWPTEGKILLQCEGAEIYFREIELHPIATTKTTTTHE